MKPTSIIQRLVILLITLMSAIGAKAAVAYASYNEENKTLTFYYDRYKALRLNTYSLNTDYDSPGWYTDGTYNNVTKVVFNSSFADARPTSTYSWFYNMANLQSIEGMNYLNTSEVTNMAWMFSYCENLTSLDLSSFNTSKVTNMKDMFYNCSNLRTIYVGNGWSTAAVTSSAMMFTNCTSLVGGQGTTYNGNYKEKTYARIDGGTSNPGYFTEKPKEAYACYTPENTTLTFYYDHLRSTRLNTYDLNTGSQDADWSTDGTKSNVTQVVFDPSFAEARPTTTYRWFYQMMNLQAIEGICNLNTSEVTNMFGMFGVCKKMKILDLSSFNTAKVNNMGGMFWKCSELQTIYVGDGWSTAAVTGSSRMFEDCTELKGGQGTSYNSSYVDKTYAHIDGGPSYPGYFTARNTGITTDIENGQRDAVKVQSEEWFTIDGQKLSGKPTKKGVYIYNGRAVVL